MACGGLQMLLVSHTSLRTKDLLLYLHRLWVGPKVRFYPSSAFRLWRLVSTAQQQHVGNNHLVDLNNHAFPLGAENWIILRTLLATTLPTFICGFTFFLVARRGVLINTSPPIKLPLSWQCQGET